MNKRETINPDKKEKVSKLSEILSGASSVSFINYAGMDVAAQQELKKRLREAGSTMLVSKNTLTKLAGAEANLPEDALSDEILNGQIAIVVASADPVAPIQILGKFNKEFEMPEFKAGVVEGAFQDKEGLVAVSKLPGKEELSAQVVGAVAAPLYGIVGTLQGNLQKLIFILNEAKEKAGGGEVHG